MVMSDTDLSSLLGETPKNTTDLTSLLSDPFAAEQPLAVGAAAAGGVAYDASSKIDRLAMWQPAIRSADAELLPEKETLDARVKDTLRNDAYVAGGATIRKDSIVGSQFRLNSKPETAILWGKEDKKWEEEFQEEVETKFALVAESEENWFDYSRQNTLTGLTRLAVGIHLAGGEVLGLSQWSKDNGRPYRSAVQLIDIDRLSTPYDRVLTGTTLIRNGVELDRNTGEHIAYHIRKIHPSDAWYNIGGEEDYLKWQRIPTRTSWGRLRVLHIYEQMRVDQSRGVSELVTALTESRMGKHFRKVELERAVVAASYAASIESEFPDDIASALGGDAGDGNRSVQWMNDYLSAINAYSSGARNLHMDGAKIPVFAPGTKLKIQNPGGNSPLGDKYEQSILRYIAASLNMSYEQLSRDFTQTNYSSARAAMGETQKSMQSLKAMVADRFATFVYRLWLEEAINNNDLECLKRRNVPNFYEGLNAEAYSACEWIGAGQGQIDPLKETQASILRLKAGLTTKEIEIAKSSGGDFRRIERQIQRERELSKFHGNPSIYDQAGITDVENSLSATPNDGDK